MDPGYTRVRTQRYSTSRSTYVYMPIYLSMYTTDGMEACRKKKVGSIASLGSWISEERRRARDRERVRGGGVIDRSRPVDGKNLQPEKIFSSSPRGRTERSPPATVGADGRRRRRRRETTATTATNDGRDERRTVVVVGGGGRCGGASVWRAVTNAASRIEHRALTRARRGCAPR